MKRITIYFLLALSLTILGAYSQEDKREAVLKETSEAFEKGRIKAGFDKIGIGEGYEIVVADRCDLVENTASEMLQKFLIKGGLNVRIVPESKVTGKKQFLLGRDSNLKTIKDLGDKGDIDIRNVSVEDDGFHLKQTGGNIVIAGANPRGVLYGVYAFEDFINAGANGNFDFRKIPYYRKRANAAGNYFNSYGGELTEEKAAYLSRLGANQYAGDADELMSLNMLVKSDVFPFQKPPQVDYQRKVSARSALCKKYGLDYYMWLWEPLLPSQSGDVEKYPKEVLGLVKRPWGGEGSDNRTLCINSPIVKEHYRNLVKHFVREFTDVKGFVFYNLDGSAWLCTPGLCERCKEAVKDSPHDLYNPWETQAQLLSLLAKAAHEERPDFKFNFWGPVHFRGEAVGKLFHRAEGYDALSTSWDGSDRDVMISTDWAKKPCEEFLMTQQVAEERGIPMYALFPCNRLECVPQGFPYPFHVCSSLKIFKEWGVTHLLEDTGPTPALNSINALVMKDFQCDPEQDPVAFLSSLSVRQFGRAAGKIMFGAWEEVRDAMDVWNGYRVHPLCGSQFCLSIGLIPGVPNDILPHVAADYERYLQVKVSVEPWRAPYHQRFREKSFLEAFKRMGDHLAKAARLARKAVDEASDKEFIDICYYEESNGRPTCKEYAELNYASIAIADAVCQQKVNMLRAYHLLNEIEACRAAGDKNGTSSKEKQYHTLIRDDIALQESFVELLTGLSERKPCLTRASLTEQQIAEYIIKTREKIEKLKKFLTINEGKSSSGKG